MRLTLAFLVLAPLAASPVAAQEASSQADRFFPRQGFMLAGYGGAGFTAVQGDGETRSNFSTTFAPIMLFQISDRFLFEGEFEFELEEGVSGTTLEYAQVDISLNDNFVLVAGKFLMPFAAFSERFHPTWINRLPSVPAVYGSHGNPAVPADPMLPILSDVGIQLRGAFDLGEFRTITTELFVTQGPSSEAETPGEGDDHSAAAKTGSPANLELGDLSWGANIPDNNTNKLIGGRVGFGVSPYFEVNVSGMTAKYDAEDELGFDAAAVHVEGRRRGFTVHGELVQTWQDVVGEVHEEGASEKRAAAANEGPVETVSRTGYWAQVGYRHGKVQPVFRFSRLLDGKFDGETIVEGGQQLSFGLDYWFEPSLVLKLEYMVNDETVDVDNNRLAVQLAFGF